MSCDDQFLALLVWSLESRQSLDGTFFHSSSFFLFPVAIQTSFETSLYLTRSLRLDAFFLSIPPFYHDVEDDMTVATFGTRDFLQSGLKRKSNACWAKVT